MKREKNVQIQSIRGFAAIMIVIFHYTYRYDNLYGMGNISFPTLELWGTVGVSFFFFLSGFLSFQNATDEFDVKKYWKNKFSSLYLSYFISVILIYVIVSLFGLPGREVSFVDLILNICLMNGFIGTPYVDGAHWYMTFIIVMYIYWMFIRMFKIQNKVICVPAVLVISKILSAISRFLPQPFANVISVLSGRQYIFYFTLGIAIACILKLDSKSKMEVIYYVYLVAIGIYILRIEGLTTVLMLCIGIVFVLLAQKKTNQNSFIKISGFIGNISYQLYLVHQNIGYIIINRMKDCAPFPIVLIFTICVVIAISSIIWRLSNAVIKKVSQS